MSAVELGLNQQAPAIVEKLAWWMAGQERAVRMADCWPLVREVAEGAPSLTVLPTAPEQWQETIRSSIMALAIHRMWATSKRTVFPVHPLLVDELADSTSGELPGPIFDHLPRPNPLVLFPRPLPVTTPDGHRGEILGFYIYGRRAESNGQLCSTDDPRRDALGVMAATSLLDERGKQIDLDLTRFTVPVGRERFTVAEATDNTLTAFAAEPGMMLMSSSLKDWVSTLTRAALHVLLYLCSDQPDVVTRPAPRRKPTNRPKKSSAKPPQIYNVGWELGPALLDARRSSNDDAAPATFRTIWSQDSAKPTLIFHHADHQLDTHLAFTVADNTELRQALHDAQRTAETLRARTIDLENLTSSQRDTIVGLRASRMRLTRATLRYRAEAAAVGTPEHLQSLQRQLHRRTEELSTANSAIDDLTTQLQQAHRELNQRTARYPPPSQLDGDSTDTSADHHELAPASWSELSRAAADLPHLWCSPDLAELAAHLPLRRDWLTTTWRVLRALSDYATARHAAHSAGRPLAPLRNFAAYLQADVRGSKISASQLALGESETVLNNPRLRGFRERPVPAEVDARGRALHIAHVRIGQAAPYPRLHFLDATDTAGLICVGYLGPHLPTS